MHVSVLTWLLGAVLTFWCVGLYQRLLRLRLQVQQALGELELPLAGFGRLLAAQVATLQGSGPLTPAWSRLTQAVDDLPMCCQKARNEPLAAVPLRALADQLDSIAAAWLQLQGLPDDLAGPSVPQDLTLSWQEAEFNARAARNRFNQLVDNYNHALGQFPARLVVRLLGFKAAVTL